MMNKTNRKKIARADTDITLFRIDKSCFNECFGVSL
jgi:hypothetical protein